MRSGGHSPAASLSRHGLGARPSAGAASLCARSEVPPSANPASAARACGAQTAERRTRGAAADAAPRARCEEQGRNPRSDPRLHPNPGQEAFAQVYRGLSEAGYIGSGARQGRGFPQGPEPAHSPGRLGGGAAGPQRSAGGSQAPGEAGAGGPAAAPGASGRSREGMLTRPLAKIRAGAAPGGAAAAGGGGGTAGAACSAGRRATSGLWQEGAGAHVALADTATSMARLGCEGFDQSQ